MKSILLSACLLTPVLFAGVASAQPAAPAAAPTLRAGDRGEEVAALQRALTSHGHALSADGVFGPQTTAAVTAFQRAQGLTPDGVVGPRTWAALGRAGSSGGTAGIEDRVAGRTGTPAAPYTGARPAADSSPSEARTRSLAWARASRAAGIRTLVIAFEGLWSYSSSYAEEVYAYQRALRAGGAARAPRGATMNFVGKNLLVPSMGSLRSSCEFLILPETSENRADSVGFQTALAWHEVYGPELNLVLVGHSFGAYSALRLSNKLAERGVRVDHFLAVDARTMPGNYRHFVRPCNVGTLHNYFQKGLMPGYSIDGADLNQRLRGASHGAMPGTAPVRERFLSLLR